MALKAIGLGSKGLERQYVEERQQNEGVVSRDWPLGTCKDLATAFTAGPNIWLHLYSCTLRLLQYIKTNGFTFDSGTCLVKMGLYKGKTIWACNNYQWRWSCFQMVLPDPSKLSRYVLNQVHTTSNRNILWNIDASIIGISFCMKCLKWSKQVDIYKS